MMFSFLILFGLLLIIVGLSGEKASGKEISENEEKIYSKIMENIEPVLEALIEFKEESEGEVSIEFNRQRSFGDVLERVDKPSYNEETIKIIQQYEEGNYTIEEACNILNMKKGEVLLLRNIYKKFQR
ncbi:MAG: hypothetical protein GX231_00170 [Tissierellia bacterium]|nr:hypothetical protein [Tissierellia bacterium]